MNERQNKAVVLLGKYQEMTLAKARIARLIIAGINDVQHHTKITLRIVQAIDNRIREVYGDKYHTYMKRDGPQVELNTYGGEIPHNNTLSIRGVSHGELIAEAQKYADATTEVYDTTLANLEELEQIEVEARALQKRLEEKAPALWLLREIYEYQDMYKLYSIY